MGNVPLKSVLGTQLFDYDKAENSAGWIRELEGEHTPETEEYGISSFVYQTNQPFDAAKLWEFFNSEQDFSGVLRSKGFFWVAANHSVAYEWAQAGGVSNVHASGIWQAAMPKEYWADLEDPEPEKGPNWHARFGDRMQQLVFIGQRMNEAAMRARLDGSLLDKDLAAGSSENWMKLHNPFPEFSMEEAAA